MMFFSIISLIGAFITGASTLALVSRNRVNENARLIELGEAVEWAETEFEGFYWFNHPSELVEVYRDRESLD